MPARAVCLLAACLAATLAVALVSAQPADSEGASLSFMPEYVQWVKQNCGDPAKVTGGPCQALKDKMCGTRPSSEVLCVNGEARFRSSSRYTRVTYLTCSLTALKCTTSAETYKGAARSVDPEALAAWVSGRSAACSRPNVKCAKDTVEFLDMNDKKVVLSADNSKGLVFLK